MTAILQGSYDPDQVVVTIAGVILSGFSDGDYIECARDEDVYFKRVGADGGVGRARNANKSGSITIRLLQTSAANAQLSTLLAISDLTNDGSVVFPISVFDGSGTSLSTATQCWIKTLPPDTKGKEVGEREWIFDCADLRIFHGGNA